MRDPHVCGIIDSVALVTMSCPHIPDTLLPGPQVVSSLFRRYKSYLENVS